MYKTPKNLSIAKKIRQQFLQEHKKQAARTIIAIRMVKEKDRMARKKSQRPTEHLQIDAKRKEAAMQCQCVSPQPIRIGPGCRHCTLVRNRIRLGFGRSKGIPGAAVSRVWMLPMGQIGKVKVTCNRLPDWTCSDSARLRIQVV